MLNSNERNAMSRARRQIDRGGYRPIRRRRRGGVFWVVMAVIGAIAATAYFEGYLGDGVSPVRAQYPVEEPATAKPTLPGGIEIEVVQRRP